MTSSTLDFNTHEIEDEIVTLLRQIGDELNTIHSLESDNIVAEQLESNPLLHSDQEGTSIDPEATNAEAEDQEESTDEDTAASNDAEVLLSDEAQQSPLLADDAEDAHQGTHICLECEFPSADLIQIAEPMPTVIPDFIG